jgi:hypothetical protein
VLQALALCSWLKPGHCGRGTQVGMMVLYSPATRGERAPSGRPEESPAASRPMSIYIPYLTLTLKTGAVTNT